MFHNSATPDGRYLIVVDQPNSFFDQTTGPSDSSYAALLDVSSQAIVRMAELSSPRSQMLSASSDGEWVAWTEADDAPNFFDWRLRAYNRKTEVVTEIARASMRDGAPVAGPLSFVSVSHGLAVWGQTVGSGAGPGQMENAVVRQADLETGATTTIETSAGDPWLAWPWMSLVVVEESTGYTKVVNLDTSLERRFDFIAPQFLISGGSAIYNDARSSSMWLIEDLAQPTSAIEIGRSTGSSDYLEWPTLNERVAGWSQTSRTVVYDRAQERLVSVPMLTGRSAVTVSGPLMVWTDNDADSDPYARWSDWFMVVDTRTLPMNQ